MNQAPPTTEHLPLIRERSQVAGILERAAAGKSLVLTRRGLAIFEDGSFSELKRGLQNLGQHQDDCPGATSREILGEAIANNLEHATPWVDAGALYEDLIEFLEQKAVPDFIFCLDPWAAQLRSRAGEIAAGAQWVLVSDLDTRKRGTHQAYWEQQALWFGGLSFSAVILKNVWDEALHEGDAEAPSSSGGRVHLERQGAWQWRRITDSVRKAASGQGKLLFLVSHSGSVPHLRVLLDSIGRQDYPKASLRALVVTERRGAELRDYLRWFALSHPEVRTAIADSKEEWRGCLEDALKENPQSTVILVDDHAILPDHFARGAARSAEAGLPISSPGIPIGLDASAHVITGNLDPLANYESLLKAFSARQGSSPVDGARIFPPATWLGTDGDAVSSVLQAAREGGASPATKQCPQQPLLKLADLP